MDRIAPRHRPGGRAVGYQRWRNLLFVHWPVPEETLRPLVPRRLSIDRHDGVAWVGLTPFAAAAVRPRWVPAPLAFRFLETNVRTYVHLAERDPGVWFFSLDAASRLAVRAARAAWYLPYHFADIRLRFDGDHILYEVQRAGPAGPRLRVRYRIGEALGEAAPGSLEFFLIERYILYAQRNGRLYQGRVHHRPYPLHRAEIETLDDDLVSAAGLPRLLPPPIAHYSPGVDVEVFPLVRV